MEIVTRYDEWNAKARSFADLLRGFSKTSSGDGVTGFLVSTVPLPAWAND